MNSYAAAVKACVAVLVLGITGVIIEFQQQNIMSLWKDIVEVGIAIAGIIGVAYVLKTKVDGLTKWAWGENGVNDWRSETNKILSELSAVARGNAERIKRLEDHEDNARRKR